ncbi:hypothetical protein NQD34_000503 [Periophthalmus magnuspinnatus]|nr:hypothetical protein NQD34_000503 [Periophthalmus magnuspinnatus]
MALNIYGVVAVVVFYLLILGTGVWAAQKSRRAMRKSRGDQTEVVLLGDRNINLVVGIFTMTATWVGGGFILGVAEAVYNPKMGLIWALMPIQYSLSFILGGVFFAKPMRDKMYITMMDPFQQKYGKILSGILVLPALLVDVLWVSCTLLGLGDGFETHHCFLYEKVGWPPSLPVRREQHCMKFLYKGLLQKVAEYLTFLLIIDTGIFNARSHDCMCLRTSCSRTEIGKSV